MNEYILRLLLATLPCFAVLLPSSQLAAETRLYGSLHGFLSKTEGKTGLSLNSYASRAGIKGAHLLQNGWRLSHNLELELNTLDSNPNTNFAKISSTVDSNNPDDTEIDLRNAWIGIKNHYGEFRIGRHPSLSDIMDNGQDLLSRAGHALISPGYLNPSEQILYVNRNGHLGYSFSWSPFEENNDDRVLSALTNYAVIHNEVSYYAGITLEKAPDSNTGVKIALGANKKPFAVGLVLDKQSRSDAKSLTLSGRYQMGKTYVAAEYGKLFDDNFIRQSGYIYLPEGALNRAVEIGYQINPKLRSYVDYAHLGNRKDLSIAVRYDF